MKICKLDKTQRQILSKLLDQYEKSKTYKGESLRRQSFSIDPSDIMEDYYSDYADVEQVRLFEEKLDEMANNRLILPRKKGTAYRRITLNLEQLQDCYDVLGREDKKAQIMRQIEFYRSFLGQNPITDGFCSEQIRLLEQDRKAEYATDDAAKLLPLCLTILNNKQDLLERELSILQFADSKLFEKSYRTRACRLLKTYGGYNELLDGIDDKREIEQIILGEHNIYSNPSYLYVKGDAEIKFRSLPEMQISIETPIALSSESLKQLEYIKIHSPRAMTIENLTSFNRMHEPGYFYLFLSGYHNTAKQHLLTEVAAQNGSLNWFHFGDLDPDGFLILEHLKRKTGIPFKPAHMELHELETFKRYGKPLQENDKRKAKTLIEKGLYTEEVTFMLSQDCKIEQEVISLKLCAVYDRQQYAPI